MTNRKKVFIYGALFVCGAALVLLGIFEYLDGYWSGMGGGLAGVAAVRLVQAARLARDPAYAKKIEISNTDERLAFVAGRAANYTFRMSVLVLAVLSMVLYPLGYASIARVLGFAMCFEVNLYWICYLVLIRRY